MKKILVADQEETICMLYAEELIEEGYDVVTISDPKDFMQVVEAETPDLILLDIWMVKNDNATLRRYIRSNLYDTPIILSTTHMPSKHFLVYLGVDDFVMKSFNLNELKAKIKKQLEGLKTSQVEMRQPCKNKKIPSSHSGDLLGRNGQHCLLCNGPGGSFRCSSDDNKGGTKGSAR